MTKYYTEYPTQEFWCESDEKALEVTKARVVYKESNSKDGLPFIMLRESITKPHTILKDKK